MHAILKSSALLTALALLDAVGASAQGPSAKPPMLRLPLDCTVGQSCFVQQYFDHDPGPGEKDYRCGARVYDGHDGTDIRLSSIAAQQRGVAVLAAADGVVRGARDGEGDFVQKTAADRAAIRDKECGNGVVISHPGGWETQYCHMAKGSIAVRTGQRVKAGDRLGLVGLSGDTQFPHLHLSVRQGTRKVDPFAPDLEPGRCSASPTRSLWTPAAAKALAYRSTELINAGFAEAAVSQDDLEYERYKAPGATSPALIFFGRAIGLQAGDILRLEVTAPDGAVFTQSDTPMESAKAQWVSYAGKRLRTAAWPAGTYRGTVSIVRAGKAVVTRTETLAL